MARKPTNPATRNTRLWRVLALLLAVETIASLATLPRTPAEATQNPILQGATIPPQVLTILDRSCRDCHSNQTRYPWYSYLAPISTLINRDVTRGRGFLNLSQWAEYPKVRRLRALTGIANQVKDGIMPLDIYIRLHPDARLSPQEQQLVFDWTQAERLRLIMQDAEPTPSGAGND